MRAIGLALALSLVGAAAPAAAQTQTQNQAPPPAAARRVAAAHLAGGPFRPTLQQLRGLQLTADQRQQVKEIFKSHQPELKAFNEKFRAARQSWQQSGQINIAQRKELLTQRAAIMKGVHDEVFQVLTPEQQKQLQARALRRR